MKPSRRIVVCLIGFVGVASAQPARYLNSGLGYSFAVPPGWRVEPGYQGSAAHIVSFAPSQEGPELPAGGAAIH